jgi:selenide, water dikinase
MREQPAHPRHIVLIGAGHAHLHVLRAFEKRPREAIKLTLVTREKDIFYTGMLPGILTGEYRASQARIDTRILAERADADHRIGEVIGLDVGRKILRCRDGSSLSFDILSMDLGAMPNIASVDGAACFAVPVKPIDRFIDHFDTMIPRFLSNPEPIAVVGAGAAGVELMFAIHRRLTRMAGKLAKQAPPNTFHLITQSAEILSESPRRLRESVRRKAAARAIRIHVNARVIRIEQNLVCLASGEKIEVGAIYWATEGAAPPWLRATDLILSRDGFIRVDRTLRAVGQREIFAAGDVASFDPPLPKSGVFAVRAGPLLATNIRALAIGRPLRPFRPPASALYLLSSADGQAHGAKFGFSFSGRPAWWLKAYLDRTFVRRFQP